MGGSNLKNEDYARLFLKMTKYDCILLKIFKAAKCVMTVAVIINALISGIYVFSSLRK